MCCIWGKPWEISGLNILISSKQVAIGGEVSDTVTQADILKSQEQMVH